jgi:hypothetical protein
MYSRIIDNEVLLEYMDGVDSFIEFTKASVSTVDFTGQIRCPCTMYKNNRFVEPHDIRHHLYKNGFVSGYQNWILHDEKFRNNFDAWVNMVHDNPYMDLIFDAAGPKLDSAMGPSDVPTG